MLIRFASLLCFAAALSVMSSAAHAGGGGRDRANAVILSLDGNAFWIAKELERRGKAKKFLSVLKKYKLDGPRPLLPNFSSKTAPGHASLFTGTYSDVHQVTGNSIFKLPLSKNSIAEKTNGFSSQVLKAKPIWEITAAAGVDTKVFQASHVVPFGEQQDDLFLFDGYSGPIKPDRIFDSGDLSSLGGTVFRLSGRFHDLYLRKESGNLLVSRSRDFSDQKLLKKGFENRISLRMIRKGKKYQFYLAWLEGKVGERNFKLYQSYFSHVSTQPSMDLMDLMQEEIIPPYVPNGSAYALQRGDFGKAGEDLYVETVLAAIDSVEKMTQLIQKKKGRGELEIHYLPFPDEVLHNWAAYLMREAGQPSEVAWMRVERIFDRIGTYIDRVIFSEGKAIPAHFFLVSDHGMTFFKYKVYLNEVLARAGLLHWKRGGEVDLKRTSVYYPKAGSMFLKVNRKSYKDGKVADEKLAGVIEKAKRALLRFRDPRNGKKIVSAVYPASEWKKYGSNDGPQGGELYLDFAPGYFPFPEYQRGKTVVRSGSNFTGMHGFVPERADMWGALWVASSSELNWGERVLQTQIAPTILKLLEVKVPDQMKAMDLLKPKK